MELLLYFLLAFQLGFAGFTGLELPWMHDLYSMVLLGLVEEEIENTHQLVWEIRTSCWLSGFGFSFAGLFFWPRTTMDAWIIFYGRSVLG